MCGIVGVAGNMIQQDYKVFRDMLLMDVVRGQDSTGVLRVPKGDMMPEIQKDLGHPCNLWDWYNKKSIFDYDGVVKFPSKVLLGHNRAATKGVVTVDNAHPFRFGHIYGVHNGTLWDTKDLEGDHEVDSKCIYQTIQDKGIEHTWENLYGAAALVWWDDKDDSLNFIRNEERTLYLINNSVRDVILWASESWMLQAAMARNKMLPPKDKDDKYETPVIIEPHKHYKVYIKATGYEFEKEIPTLKKRQPRTQVYTPTSSANSTNGTLRKKGLFNQGWARDSQKAGKEIRGQMLKVDMNVSMIDSRTKETKYYMVGHTLDGNNRVEIYPQRYEEYEYWVKQLKSNGNGGVLAKFKQRPRYITNFKGEKTYKVSALGVKRHIVTDLTPKNIPPLFTGDDDDKVIYIGRHHQAMTASEFKKALNEAGQSCAYCGDVFDENDKDNVVFKDKTTMLCNACDESYERYGVH